MSDQSLPTHGPDELTLDQLLALKLKPKKVMEDQVQWIGAPARELPYEKQPPLLLRFNVLGELSSIIDVHDVGRFIEEPSENLGRFTLDAVAWCDEMRAVRTAEMLRRAIALLPADVMRPDVLADNYIARARAMDEARGEDDDPFEALKKEYRDVEAELGAKCLEYARAHRDALRTELASIAGLVASGDSASSLLAIEDDMEFLDALDNALQRAVGGPNGFMGPDGWGEMPPSRRVVFWVRGCILTIGSSGSWKLVESDTDRAALPQAPAWLRGIGAERAAAYMEAIVAALPDGRLPEDEEEAIDVLESIEGEGSTDKTDPWNGIDPLRRVDIEHDGALDDAVAALRDFVAGHPDDLSSALDRAVEGGPAGTRRVAAQPAGTVSRAPTPAPQPLGHAALDALFARAHGLTRDEWVRVVRRRFADAARYDAAFERLGRAAQAVAKGGAMAGGAEGTKRRRALDSASHPLMHAVTSWLPAVHTDADGAIPLRLLAFQLVLLAERAELWHDAMGDAAEADAAVITGALDPRAG